MDMKLVLVEKEDQTEVCSSSGILLSNKYVLVTGNLLWKSLHLDTYNINENLASGSLLTNGFNEYSGRINVKWKCQNDAIVFKEAKIFAVFLNRDLFSSSKSIFQDWKIDDEKNNIDINLMLGLFFVLTLCDETGSTSDFKLILHYWWNHISNENIYKGDDIHSSSVLFGNINFFNSYAQGIVSNILGNNSSLIVSDMPSTPGSEGSPVFCCSSNKIPVGIIISSLNWWKNEWVGSTLIADIRPILKQLLIIDSGPSHDRKDYKNMALLDTIESCLIKVCCGSNWGTGIIFDKNKGIIITNSHVVDSNKLSNVVIYWKNYSAKCKVIYRTPDDTVFDIAILRCNKLNQWDISSINIFKGVLNIGNTIYSAGFSLVSDKSICSPTISKGHISHISRHMIKTTSSVHAGASGGAILTENGDLVGIIVCNVKLPNNSVYPKVNMAIPISEVAHIIDTYLTTNDEAILQTLERNVADALKLWKMLKGKL